MNDVNRGLVIIGAGNVGQQLGLALKEAGYPILQVMSRSRKSAERLAEKLGVDFTMDRDKIVRDAGMYLVCVNDDAMEEVVAGMNPAGKCIVHTSGSTPLDLLKNYTTECGVLYPFQTISRIYKPDFKKIPLLVEASTTSLEEVLLTLARRLSDIVQPMDSRQRQLLHLSAVFACNFSNHMYACAKSLLDANGISFAMLHPLILETARKAMRIDPKEAQTGPAVRNDSLTIEKQRAMLEPFPELQKLYTFVTGSITSFHFPDAEKIQ